MKFQITIFAATAFTAFAASLQEPKDIQNLEIGTGHRRSNYVVSSNTETFVRAPEIDAPYEQVVFHLKQTMSKLKGFVSGTNVDYDGYKQNSLSLREELQHAENIAKTKLPKDHYAHALRFVSRFSGAFERAITLKTQIEDIFYGKSYSLQIADLHIKILALADSYGNPDYQNKDSCVKVANYEKLLNDMERTIKEDSRLQENMVEHLEGAIKAARESIKFVDPNDDEEEESTAKKL